MTDPPRMVVLLDGGPTGDWDTVHVYTSRAAAIRGVAANVPDAVGVWESRDRSCETDTPGAPPCPGIACCTRCDDWYFVVDGEAWYWLSEVPCIPDAEADVWKF
jgi:hypothetical protein